MSLSFKDLRELRQQANFLGRSNINGETDNSVTAKYGVRTGFLIVAIILFYWLPGGLNDTFISFASSVLAILVGLFITALVFSFDKFYQPKGLDTASSADKLSDTQGYNYTKKFAYVTGHTIMLCMWTLILLGIALLFPTETKLNIFELSFCKECLKLSVRDPILLFLLATIVTLQRIFIIYFLLRIMYNTAFVVSSMVHYMATKMEKK